MEVLGSAVSARHARSHSMPGLRTPSGGSVRHPSVKGHGSARRKSLADRASRKCCGSTSLCWWEPDMDDVNNTVDFSLETSLHGLKYICQPQRHLFERVFWFIAFLIGVAIAGWLISDIWMTYRNSPVVVTFQPFETTIDQIPFPAVTICNMNKVLKSKANQYIKAAQGQDSKWATIQARKNIYYMEHVCSASKSFSQKFNFSSKRGMVDSDILGKARIRDGDDEQSDVARFLQSASQKCSDMLLLCVWQDEVHNCSELFKPIETDFGKCCTFNMIPQTLLSRYLNDTRDDPKEVADWSTWDYEKDGFLMPKETKETEGTRTFPRRQRRAGKSSGLSVLLNPDLEEYFCTSSDSQGFRLVKHLPLDVPHVVDFGIAVRPNAEIFMGVRPEITRADPDIRNFKLEKRNCYFRNEFQLAYFNHYTTSNCFDECLANQTYSTCGCVRYYMPRDDTRDLCGASKFNCAEDIRKSSLKTGIKSTCDFCLPTCTELEYVSETTVTPIQKGVNIWVDDKNVTASWAKKNVTIVHIYFSSDSTYARVRKELYGLTDLIANTGGLMGLCLGFSGLSLIELVYFYTLRSWCRTRRKRSIWSIVGMKLHRILLKTKAREDRYGHADGSSTRASASTSAISSVSQNKQDRRIQPPTTEGLETFGRYDSKYWNLKNKMDESSNNFVYPNGIQNQGDILPDELANSMKIHNPFVVIPEDSKPSWRRFSGFGTQFTNSKLS